MFTRGYITWKNMFLMGLSMNLRMLLYVSENWVHRYSHFFMAILSGKLEALDHQILSNVGTLFSNKQGSVTDCYSILVKTYRGIGRSKCANFGLCQILRPLDAFASNCCNWSAAWWVSPRCSNHDCCSVLPEKNAQLKVRVCVGSVMFIAMEIK